MPGFEEGAAPGDADWIADSDVMDTLGMTWWAHPRRVVLCSATLDENVQVLAGKTLINPKIVRGIKDDAEPTNDAADSADATSAVSAVSGRRPSTPIGRTRLVPLRFCLPMSFINWFAAL